MMVSVLPARPPILATVLAQQTMSLGIKCMGFVSIYNCFAAQELFHLTSLGDHLDGIICWKSDGQVGRRFSSV